MGCDIHVLTERIKKDWETKEEKWVNCDHYKKNSDYDPTEEYGEREWERLDIYRPRNYGLFSVLANVRNNGYWEPISLPKGVPNDIDTFTKEQVEIWDGDGHSHSYFTLKELKDWARENKTRKNVGFFHPKSVEKFDEEGIIPEFWFFESNGTYSQKREWTGNVTILDELIESLEERKRFEFHLWNDEENYDEYDDKIRMVFYFDN